MSDTTTRRYDASGRREQARATRERVVAAASDLFVTRGWSGTSMRDVAQAAGVSVETVYGSVGSKTELLKVAMEVAVVGDDEPVALSGRPEWRRVAEAPTTRERCEAVADVLWWLHRRTAPLYRTLTHAALAEESLRPLLRQDRIDIREQNRQGVTAVARRTPTELELDLVCAVTSNDTYLELVEHHGHDHQGYREFLVAAITRLLRLEDQP